MAAAKPGAPDLRVVGKGDAKSAKKKTIADAATSDDPKDLLVAMRDRLTEAVTSSQTPPRDLASVTLRLLEVIYQLDESPVPWLVMMRDRLARVVGSAGTSPRDLAALTRRLSEVVRKIAALDAAGNEGDQLGEAAAIPDQQFDGELTPDAL